MASNVDDIKDSKIKLSENDTAFNLRSSPIPHPEKL
jgi:hypothetical protein